MSQDFENDDKRSLQITDPSGNTSMINFSYKTCAQCGLNCVKYSAGKCRGKTEMLDDLGQHLCEFHKEQMGGDNRWYKSSPKETDGPVGRMLGSTDKPLSNGGGTFSDDEELGEDDNSEIRASDEDPHYED